MKIALIEILFDYSLTEAIKMWYICEQDDMKAKSKATQISLYPKDKYCFVLDREHNF